MYTAVYTGGAFSVSEYIAEKYAPSLTQEDARQMFKRLAEILGSISEAAKESGIERRTYYKMEDREYVQPSTKEKILHVALEKAQIETLGYLLKRHVSDSAELLIVNLTTLYEKAIEETDREKLVKILDAFKQVNWEYQGLIKDSIETEVQDLIAHLIDKAKVEEVVWTPRNTLYKVDEMRSLITTINRELIRGRSSKVIAEQFRVPEEIVDALRTRIARPSYVSIEECEGLLYGYLPGYNYWDRILESQNTSAGIERKRCYEIVRYIKPELQTPSSGATVTIER